ncbi:MAG: hypothetical protein WDA77_13750, partial [Acidimicrobiia bacterium]
MSMFSSSHRPFMLPGRPTRRLPARPDLRQMMSGARQSAAKVSEDEIDYDELVIVRSWRAFAEDQPNEVRYFCYELSQRDPGQSTPDTFFKVVRFLRLTRVPRWLRQQGSGSDQPGMSQMAYVLSGLREKGVLFCQLVAKTAEIPLVFAYGVQAIGSTIDEATAKADEAYAALAALLDGVFQQIEYAPITIEQGEHLARYQASWENIAVARGRPIQNSESIGMSSLMDGNRTDIEQTHNQMEAFIRGMVEGRGGFMLTLVTVPLPVEEMTRAWRNVSESLSAVRSETHGQKAATVGVALPLGLGMGAGHSVGDSHSSGDSAGAAATLGETYTEGVSHTEGVSEGVSQSTSDGVSVSDTLSHTEGTATGHTTGSSESFAEGISASTTVGESLAHTDSVSHATGSSQTYGETATTGASQGFTEARSMSESV